MKNKPDDNKKPHYNDLSFRLIMSLPVSVYMMLYRERESIFEAIADINFWIGTALGFVVSFMILTLINRISKKLDSKYPWREATTVRLIYQLCWGICAMMIFTFSLVLITYWVIFGIDITRTEYPTHDFPLVILLIVLANLYYLTYYLWLVKSYAPLDVHMESNTEVIEESAITETRKNSSEHSVYLAPTSNGIIVIPQEKIAIIYRQDAYVLLKTFDRETYTLERSIPQIVPELDSIQFFRINPRCVVNYRACKSIRQGTHGKLDISFAHPLSSTDSVSRTLVQDFEKWMKR